MIKKILLLTLVFCVLVSCVIFPASAADTNPFENMNPSRQAGTYGSDAVSKQYGASSGSTWASGSAGGSVFASSDCSYSSGTIDSSISLSNTFTYTDLNGYFSTTFAMIDTGSTIDKGTYTLSGSLSIYGVPIVNSSSSNSSSSLGLDVDVSVLAGKIFLYDWDDNEVGSSNVTITSVTTDYLYYYKTLTRLQVVYRIYWKSEVSVDTLSAYRYNLSFMINSQPTFTFSASSRTDVWSYFGTYDVSPINWTNTLGSVGSVDSAMLGSMASSLAGLSSQFNSMLAELSNNTYYLQLIANYINGSSSADTLLKQIYVLFGDSYDVATNTYYLLQSMYNQQLITYDKISEMESAMVSFFSQQLQDNQTIITDLLLIQAEIRTQSEAIQSLLRDIMSQLNEAFGNAGEQINESSDTLTDTESSLRGTVDGDYQIDSNASVNIDSVGTGGFTVVNTVTTTLFDSLPWLAALISIFLMVFIAKKTITKD